MTQIKLSVIIPVLNEEFHLKRLLPKIKKYFFEIIVIDSDSKDNTKKIVKKNKCRYFNKKFKNFSEKINFGINKSNLQWVFELHADEILEKNFFFKLKKIFKKQKNFNSISLIRNLKYKNKLIKHGGVFPQRQIRIWKKQFGFYNEKQVTDEYVTIRQKKLLISNLNIIDDNIAFTDLYFLKKHIIYAKREAKYYESFLINRLKQNKIFKDKKLNEKILYYKFPILIRPFLLFLYRYFYKKGFLDGYYGFEYCLFQTLFYRLMVDVFILKKKLMNLIIEIF